MKRGCERIGHFDMRNCGHVSSKAPSHSHCVGPHHSVPSRLICFLKGQVVAVLLSAAFDRSER